jgi:hypothetical protein
MIIVGDGAGIVNPEAVEGVAERSFLIDCVLGFLESEIGNGRCFRVGSGCCVKESDVIFPSQLQQRTMEGDLPGIKG